VKVSSVDDGSAAQVLVRTFDDGVTHDAKRHAPDGKTIIVDDSISSARTRFRYVRVVGTWKLVGGEVLKS
jgi:hypothetical protein